MKKTLAAIAVLSTFAGSSMAADVTLYGVVDLGLKYTHVDADQNGVDAVDKLEMATGNQSGSRFGLKGSENLGNDFKVGFVLENGFNADSGTLGNNGRLFGRESNLYLTGGFGTLSFGRVGQLTSGNGSYGIAGNLSPFGTSWAGAVEGSTFMVGFSRMDNTVTYKTPTFAGFTAYAQYSLDANTKDAEYGKTIAGDDFAASHTEGKASSNRYGAIGATYANGGLKLVAVGDWYNWSSNWNKSADYRDDLDDGYAVTLGGSYDFGVVRAYLGGQYFDNMLRQTSTADSTSDAYSAIGVGTNGFIKGYGLMAGVDAPVAGGTAMFAVGYADTKDAQVQSSKEEAKSSRWGVSAGYSYPFSKRTNVYAVAAYYQDSVDNYSGTPGDNRDPSQATVFLGMRHAF